MNPKFCLFQNYSGRRIWKQNAVSILLSLREGYETIYLGNPSEASSEIHLDGAFTSYSRGESGAYLLLLSWCCALKNPEKYASFGIWVDQSDFVCVTRTSFCWVSFAYMPMQSVPDRFKEKLIFIQPLSEINMELDMHIHLKYSNDCTYQDIQIFRCVHPFEIFKRLY